MIRLIILAILLYLLYRLIKSLLFAPRQGAADYGKWENGQRVDDEMVKDPTCNTYFPKKDTLPLELEGTTYYFCSEECKKAFISAHKNTMDNEPKDV